MARATHSCHGPFTSARLPMPVLQPLKVREHAASFRSFYANRLEGDYRDAPCIQLLTLPTS